jgi:DNA cross-link repair 1C protein
VKRALAVKCFKTVGLSTLAYVHSDEVNAANVVWITPIIARHKGVEIAEIGVGGGQGDLNQTHSLELYDQGSVQQLLLICNRALQAQPELRQLMKEWFSTLMKSGKGSIDLDLEILRDEVEITSQEGRSDDEFDMDNLPIDKLIPALTRLITGKSNQEVEDRVKQQRQIVSVPHALLHLC